VCLIDSDSPTVPTAVLAEAVAELERKGDRVVVGPSHDGGYYLIGLKRAHAEVFANINWSTASVFAETVGAAKAESLETVVLPLWYDVDDSESLEILRRELLRDTPPPFAVVPGYAAGCTRDFLRDLDGRGNEIG
jgi:hypothetical protein